jgi:dCMP deaminase
MSKDRTSLDEMMLAIAAVLASRSTCARRAVGCVLTDQRGLILATGYNGVARGQLHCLSGVLCESAGAPSGTNLDGCAAVHAEQNAVLMLANADAVRTCYTTASPCTSCVKLLLNTSCQRIVFLNKYGDQKGAELWTRTGRLWAHFKLPDRQTIFDYVIISISDRGVL